MTYAEDGKPLGLKSRTLVHRDGDLHYAVQCWIVDKNHHILLQKRHSKKEGSPGKWDVSCGGHIAGTEDAVAGVLREAQEELDLKIDPDKLTFLSTFRYSSQEGRNQEVIYIYLYQYDFDVKNMHYQSEEIAALKSIPVVELKKLYDNKEKTLANRQGAMEALFSFWKLI